MQKKSTDIDLNEWAHQFMIYLNQDIWPILRLLGPGLSQSARAFSQICRLGKSVLTHTPEYQQSWIMMVKDILLPALALIPANPSVSNELWTLVKSFPYPIRYSLYADWKGVNYDRHADLILIRAHIVNETKRIMRYVNKTTISILILLVDS
jgi:THO complex subunit 2